MDFASAAMWNWVARNGAKYGWKKLEAFSEAWHYGPHTGVRIDVEPKIPDVYHMGHEGQFVRVVQEDLKHWMPGNDLNVDGSFGPRTKAVTKDFQFIHGLAVDGKIGPVTRRYLRRHVVLTRIELKTYNTFWLHRRSPKLSAKDELKWIKQRRDDLHRRAESEEDGWKKNRRRARYQYLGRAVRLERR